MEPDSLNLKLNSQYSTVYVECVTQVWDYYLQQANIKFKPVVWIGDDRQKMEYSKADFVFYSRLDVINQQVVFDNYSDSSVIDSSLVNDEILVRMYDRFSLNQLTDRSILERLNLWNLKFWHFIFSTYKIDAIVFPETPHIPYSYAGFILANKLGIKVVYSATIPLKGMSYFTNSLANYNYFKEDRYFRLEKENDNQTAYREKLAKDFGFSRGKSNSKSISFFIFLLRSLKTILIHLVFFRKHEYAYLLNNKLRVLYSSRYYYELLKRGSYKLKQKRFYLKNSYKIDKIANKIIVVFAMHFEPEMALLPLAGNNYDQMIIIKKLSNWVGNKGLLYIKEHPWQFDYEKNLGFNRGLDFYKQLAKLENVRMVRLDEDIIGAIDKIDIVSTVTGTIGWEAFLAEKPVLVFSNPWYFGLPLVHYFDSSVSIENFIKTCNAQKERIDYISVYNQIAGMPKFSLRWPDSLNLQELQYNAMQIKNLLHIQ